jgi:hypothetical protein
MVRSKTKCFNFATHMARGKWTSVFATFLIMTTSCTTYLFPIFGYRQSMLSTLSTCNDIGILLGLIVEVIPTQFQAIILAYMSLYVYWSPCSEFLQSRHLWSPLSKFFQMGDLCCWVCSKATKDLAGLFLV